MTIMEKLIRVSVWAIQNKGMFSLVTAGMLVCIVIVRMIRGSGWHRPAIALSVIPLGLQSGYSLMCSAVSYLIGHPGLAMMFGALGVAQALLTWMFVRLAKAI